MEVSVAALFADITGNASATDIEVRATLSLDAARNISVLIGYRWFSLPGRASPSPALGCQRHCGLYRFIQIGFSYRVRQNQFKLDIAKADRITAARYVVEPEWPERG
jgi:hypothetical protein